MRLRLLFLSLALVSAGAAATPLEEAIGLYKEKKYPDARAAFEKIAAAEPDNAAACYYLGMTLVRRGDDNAIADALPWLEKAARLQPNNSTYLADYGGVSMSLADKNRSLSSLSLATKGRDAMEKAIAIDPDNIEARVGLMEFYSRAPVLFGLGDKAKAAQQLAEIQKRDPKRATMILVTAKIGARQYDEAFKLCDDLLAKSPDDFFALFQYSRVALASGRNLERGLECLKKYLALAPTSPNAAKPAVAWLRTGNIQEKLGHRDEARAAYQTALKIEPGNKAATEALSNLK